MKDPRYDAVGSSSLREELFKTFLTALSSGSLSSLTHDQGAPTDTDIKHSASAPAPKVESDRKFRAERALREREEQAKTQKTRVESDIEQSKSVLTSVEAETEMMSFFVDAVRDPAVSPLPLSLRLHSCLFVSCPLILSPKSYSRTIMNSNQLSPNILDFPHRHYLQLTNVLCSNGISPTFVKSIQRHYTPFSSPIHPYYPPTMGLCRAINVLPSMLHYRLKS